MPPGGSFFTNRVLCAKRALALQKGNAFRPNSNCSN